MKCLEKFLYSILLLIVCFSTAKADGGIKVGKTRIIFTSNDVSQTVPIINTSSRSFLIQTRILNYDPLQPSGDFVVTPPVFLLKGNSSQLVRIMKGEGFFQKNRESIYYFSVIARPTESQKNGMNDRLSLGYHIMLKLIYRPEGISLSPEEASCKITFSRDIGNVHITNSTPYYLTLGTLKIGDSKVYLNEYNSMIPPEGVRSVTTDKKEGKIIWQTITDYGGLSENCSQID